jgi:hypothetical protein
MVALSALAAVGAGCAATRVPAWCAGAPAPARRWTLVVPAGAAGGDAARALIQRRRLEYAVEVVEYDPKAGTPETRLASVRGALQRAEGGPHPSGPTEHVLLVGSPSALSMGPWSFEGAGQPIATDWPLTSAAVPDGRTFARGAWEQQLAAVPLRTVGRIPLDDAADIERALAATLRADDAAAAPAADAVMGTTVFGGGWPLASARDELRERGWTATVCGDRLACDAPGTAFAPAQARDPRLLVFVGGTAPLMAPAAPADGEPRASRARGGTIALAFASAGIALGVGERPDPALAGAAAVAGFTGGIEASPLGPAMYAMSHLPVELADGVPLGLAVERVRHVYWASAADDIGRALPGVQEAAARNALAAIVLGDPALCAAKHPLPVPGSPETRPAEDLPIVVAPKDAGVNAAGTDAAGPGNAPATTGKPSWLFPVLLGMFAALVALLYAAASRRQGARRATRR